MKKETRNKIGSLIIAGTMALSGVGLDKIGSNKVKEYTGVLDVKAEEYNTQEVGVYINNERTEFDVEPSIINDRVMVPMRKIFESLGATINYNDETKTITGVTEEGHTLEHKIGSNTIKIDNEHLEFDTPSLIKEDRTLVPIRFVGESLGADVYYWDEKLSYLSPETPKKSVDIIKDRPKINNDKHAAIKETINNNPNLTTTEKNFFTNEMEQFYKRCSKYLTNEIIVEKNKLWVAYDPDGSVEGTYVDNKISLYRAKSFEEKAASASGKSTCAHEYYHALQGYNYNDFYYKFPGIEFIITEGGASILSDEYFDGISYGFEKNIFRLLCELLDVDIMGYLMMGGNSRIFCSEVQKYLGSDEELNKFFKVVNKIGIENSHNKELDKNNLNEFYGYVKKIYETKYGMEIENDRLVMAYIDYICRTNKSGFDSKTEGYVVNIGGVDNANYYNNNDINSNYRITVNQMNGNDYNTFKYWVVEIPKNERYIDNSKVKKLIK